MTHYTDEEITTLIAEGHRLGGLEQELSDALAQVKAERDAHTAGKQDLAVALETVTAQRDDANAGYMAVVQRLEESAAENAALRRVIEEAKRLASAGVRADPERVLSALSRVPARAAENNEREQSALTGSSVSSSDEVTEGAE